jgi:hypothetical protein
MARGSSVPNEDNRVTENRKPKMENAKTTGERGTENRERKIEERRQPGNGKPKTENEK